MIYNNVPSTIYSFVFFLTVLFGMICPIILLFAFFYLIFTFESTIFGLLCETNKDFRFKINQTLFNGNFDLSKEYFLIFWG